MSSSREIPVEWLGEWSQSLYNKGYARGYARGLRRSLLGLLHAWHVAVSPADVIRIQDCTDADQLEEWIRRTVAGCSAEEIFS